MKPTTIGKFSDENPRSLFGQWRLRYCPSMREKASGEMLAVKVAIFSKGKMVEAQLLLRREAIILQGRTGDRPAAQDPST